MATYLFFSSFSSHPLVDLPKYYNASGQDDGSNGGRGGAGGSGGNGGEGGQGAAGPSIGILISSSGQGPVITCNEFDLTSAQAGQGMNLFYLGT